MTNEIKLTRTGLSKIVIMAMFAGITIGFVIGLICGLLGK
mgnify:CR=1 FL=1